MMSVVQRSLRLIGLSVLVTVWLGLALPVAQPYTVCPSGCPFSKIQAALDAATDGEMITVGPGVYKENLKITKSVSLVGADPAQVRLMPGGPAYALIQVGDESTLGTVRIEGFTLQQAASLVESSVYTDVLTGVQTLIFRDRQRRPSEQDLAGAGILIYRFVEQVEVLLQGNTLRLGDFGVLLMPGSGKFEFQGNTITDNDLFGVLLAVPPLRGSRRPHQGAGDWLGE